MGPRELPDQGKERGCYSAGPLTIDRLTGPIGQLEPPLHIAGQL